MEKLPGKRGPLASILFYTRNTGDDEVALEMLKECKINSVSVVLSPDPQIETPVIRLVTKNGPIMFYGLKSIIGFICRYKNGSLPF